MELEMIISIATMLVTFVCGLIAKRVDWFNNNLIPAQNILIGIITATIHFVVTKDFSFAISAAGLVAGGAYDFVHNLKKLLNK